MLTRNLKNYKFYISTWSYILKHLIFECYLIYGLNWIKFTKLFPHLQGHASFNVPNVRGDTPLSMLQSQLGSIWVSSKIADIVREHEITSGSKKSLLYKIVKDKVSDLNIEWQWKYSRLFSILVLMRYSLS